MSSLLTRNDFEAVRLELAYREARKRLYAFWKLSNDGWIDTRFHQTLADKVQRFLEKENTSATFDVLLISTSPQHGKSVSLTESTLCWWLGLHPDKDGIIISYNDDTASKFGRSNRDKLERFSEAPYDGVAPLFPNYQKGEVWNNNNACNTLGKYLRSRGIGGGITGNPADIIIIDDPIKTMEEAQSDTTKEAIWREYLASVRTRIKPNGKLIVIQTRWAEDDLIGRLLQTLNHRRVETFFAPCECVDEASDPLGRKIGDPLCPELGRGKDWIAETKDEMTSEFGLYTWSALYQCDPTPIAGAIVKPEWWQYYDYEEDLSFSKTYISVDSTFHGDDKSDFVSIMVISMVEQDYYIRTEVHEHLTFTEMLDSIRETIDQYPDYVGILIEDKANGSAAIDSLQQEYDNIVPVTPAGGKVSRLNACSRVIRQGRVKLPRSALWRESFIREFTSFPNGKHDDRVDSLSQGLNYMLYMEGENVDTKSTERVKIKIRAWSADMYEDYYRANQADKDKLIALWGFPKYGFAEEDYV